MKTIKDIFEKVSSFKVDTLNVEYVSDMLSIIYVGNVSRSAIDVVNEVITSKGLPTLKQLRKQYEVVSETKPDAFVWNVVFYLNK